MLSLIKGLTWYEWLTLTCVIPSVMSIFFVLQEWILERTRSLSAALAMPISVAAQRENVFTEADMSAAVIIPQAAQYEVENESTEEKQPSQLAA